MSADVLLFPGLSAPKLSVVLGGTLSVEERTPPCGCCRQEWAIFYAEPSAPNDRWRIGGFNTRDAAVDSVAALAAKYGFSGVIA